MPNILKYASNRIKSFRYLNKLYYIIESTVIMYYIVQTFQQNSSLQNRALGLPQLQNSFVGFHVYRVIYSLKVTFCEQYSDPKNAVCIGALFCLSKHIL